MAEATLKQIYSKLNEIDQKVNSLLVKEEKPTKSELKAIRAGKKLNGTATGEQVAGVIIEYFGQHLNEAFKKKMYDQFKSIKKEHAIKHLILHCSIK